MTVTHSALVHCPEVKELDVHLYAEGCLGPEWDRPDFPFAEGDRYPPLKRLVLDGYRFGGLLVRHETREGRNYGEGQEGTDGPCMGPARENEEWLNDERYLNFDINKDVDSYNNELLRQWDEQGSKPQTNLDLWLQAMDWSQLEELNINTGRTEMAEAVAELPQRLMSLKLLHASSLPFIKNLRNNTLGELHWVGETDADDLHTILSHQGDSLKRLEFRCDEFKCPDWPDYMDATSLRRLAPNLEYLSINLPRNSNGTWPLAHLEGLANQPSLSHLDLYFRMEAPCTKHDHSFGFPYPSCGTAYKDVVRCRGSYQYMAPYLNSTTASYMFSYLRDNNPSGNISSVTFHTGDWQQDQPGFAAYGSKLVLDQRNVVYCSIKQGIEVCEAENDRYWRGYYGGDWVRDDGTWVVDNDLEDLLDWDEREDDESMAATRERVRKRLEERQAGMNA